MKKNKNIRKRIFLISNMWPDETSPGYGSFVKNVIEGLAAHGYSVTRKALIVGRPHGRNGKMRSYLSFYWNILMSFLRGGYDMIYIHFPNQAVPVLRQLYRLRKPILIVNYHGEDLLYEKGGYVEKLGRQTDSFLKRFASRIVVPSSYFKNIVINRGISREEHVIVSPSGGISEDIFYPMPEEQLDIPDVYTQDRPLHIGYVGRLEKEKGILDFLSALSMVKNKRIPVKATVVGYGSLESEAVDLMNDKGLHDTVEFLGGLPQSQLGDCYRSMDLFVFPTLAPESLGLTGIEALACGIPVIGTEVGGIVTYLKDGVNGLLVGPGNVGALAVRIEEFSKLSAMRRKEMRNRCIASGQEFYSKKVCECLSLSFDQVLEVYPNNHEKDYF